eukprot:SAG11_NODE_3492_length_2414_cov_13.059611_3_plen_78_part_00
MGTSLACYIPSGTTRSPPSPLGPTALALFQTCFGLGFGIWDLGFGFVLAMQPSAASQRQVYSGPCGMHAGVAFECSS